MFFFIFLASGFVHKLYTIQFRIIPVQKIFSAVSPKRRNTHNLINDFYPKPQAFRKDRSQNNTAARAIYLKFLRLKRDTLAKFY